MQWRNLVTRYVDYKKRSATSVYVRSVLNDANKSKIIRVSVQSCWTLPDDACNHNVWTYTFYNCLVFSLKSLVIQHILVGSNIVWLHRSKTGDSFKKYVYLVHQLRPSITVSVNVKPIKTNSIVLVEASLSLHLCVIVSLF